MVATLIIILLSVLRYNLVLSKADKLAFKTVIYVNINNMKEVFILELSSKSFQNGNRINICLLFSQFCGYAIIGWGKLNIDLRFVKQLDVCN